MKDYYKGFIHVVDKPRSYIPELDESLATWGLRCNFKKNHYGIWRCKGKYPLLSFLVLFFCFVWPIKKIEVLEEGCTPPENKTVIFEALK